MQLSVGSVPAQLRGGSGDQDSVGMVQKIASSANYVCLGNMLIQHREG